MSFRRKTNQHDRWIRFRERNAEAFLELGIPLDLLQNEQSLADFLTSGSCDKSQVNLQSLSHEQFLKLHKLAYEWFEYYVVAFTAIEKRRQETWSNP